MNCTRPAVQNVFSLVSHRTELRDAYKQGSIARFKRAAKSWSDERHHGDKAATVKPLLPQRLRMQRPVGNPSQEVHARFQALSRQGHEKEHKKEQLIPYSIM